MFRDKRGQSLVEMALALPILLLLLFGIVEFGRVLDAWLIATNAAREGARYAAVGSSSSTVTDQTFNYLQKGLAGRSDVTYNKAGISVAFVQPGVPGTSVTVTAQVQIRVFTPLFQGFLRNPMPVTGTATMQLQ